MKRIIRAIRTPLLCVLCVAVAIFAILYPMRDAVCEEGEAWRGVLRLWQIDSFEGGRGFARFFFELGCAPL